MNERDKAEADFHRKAHKLSGHNLIAHQLNGIRLAIREHSENTGKWLAAVALAASTPNDNSAEVQRQIDKLTGEVKTEADAFEGAAKKGKQ